MGRQYDKRHAATIIATAAISAGRAVAFDGGYPSAAGGGKDVAGIAEHDAAIGQAVSVIDDYSAIAEAGGAVTLFSLVKPATDGSGKLVAGTLADHCGRALSAAAADGDLFEVQLLPHRHA